MTPRELAEKTMELYCMHSDVWEDIVGNENECCYMDHAYQEYMLAGETVPESWDEGLIDHVNKHHQELWDIHSREYGAK